jgi:hypothetical protein
VPLVPASIPPAAVTAAKLVADQLWTAGLRLHDAHEAREQIGIVMPAALVETLCPNGADATGVWAAVELILAAMAKVGVPTSGKRRGFRRLEGWIPKRLRAKRKQIPPATRFGHKTFYELLADWLDVALDEPGVVDALAGVRCGGAAIEPQRLVATFPSAFYLTLDAAEPTKWRRELLTHLMEADDVGRWAASERERHKRALYGTAGSVAIGGATIGAAELAGAATTTFVIVTAAIAAVIAGASALRGEHLPARPSGAMLEAVRHSVRGWLEDAAVATKHGACSDPGAVLAWLVALEQPAQPTGAVVVPGHLLDDLGERLLPAAAGDEQLAAALYSLHDGLLRAARGPCASMQAAVALRELVALTALAPPPADGDARQLTTGRG